MLSATASFPPPAVASFRFGCTIAAMTSAAERRNTTVGAFLAHAFGSAATVATVTIATIVGAELSGRTWLAGVPGAAGQAGGAVTAVLVAWFVARFGRRFGLTAGAAIGAAGMALAAVGVIFGSIVLVLAGLVVGGTATAAVKFGRYVAADVHPEASRGLALSIVVMGGTVGSVMGPALVPLSSRWATAAGLPELAGPYLTASVLFLAATTCFALLVRGRTRADTRTVESHADESRTDDVRTGAPAADGQASQGSRSASEGARPARTSLFDRRSWGFDDPGVVTATVALVASQAVMTLLMGITSLHMREHDHGLGAISAVFSGHTLGMFAFSVASGWATDRFGRAVVMVWGAVLLVVSCVLAPLSNAFFPIFVALFILGLGWNLCYVAGSALLADRLQGRDATRAKGLNEALVGAVAALSAVLGGVLFALFGYGLLAIAGGIASAALWIVVGWWQRTHADAPRANASAG